MEQPVLSDQYLWIVCRCGEPVKLSAHGTDVRTCMCGRRFSWDGEMIGIVRPEGEREQ